MPLIKGIFCAWAVLDDLLDFKISLVYTAYYV
jgi:hypothetical protein